jgi:thioredoxin-like negative regulator of GroEL
MRRRWPIVAVALGVPLLVCAVIGFFAGLALCLSKAELAIDRKDWAGAERWIQRYLLLRPNDPRAILISAQALTSLGRCPEARARLARIADNSPNGPIARIREAEILLLCDGYAARAERLLQRAIELDPRSSEARRLLLYLYRVEDRPHDAREVAWSAYECAPLEDRCRILATWFLCEFAQLKAHEVFPMLHRFIKNDPTDVDAAVALAGVLFGQADVKGALRELEARSPPAEHLNGRALLVQCHFDLGDAETARSLLETWRNKDDSRYWRLRGIEAQLFGQDPRQAIEWFRRVLEKHPDDWQIRHRLAASLRAAGQFSEADAEQNETYRIQSVVTHEAVKNIIDQRLRRLDTDAAARYEMGQFYEQLCRHREARCWYDEAQRLDPSHAASREAVARLAGQKQS